MFSRQFKKNPFWPISDEEAAAEKGLNDGPVSKGLPHVSGPLRVHPGRLPLQRQREQHLQCILRDKAENW